jgi:hypothetical protein
VSAGQTAAYWQNYRRRRRSLDPYLAELRAVGLSFQQLLAPQPAARSGSKASRRSW